MSNKKSYEHLEGFKLIVNDPKYDDLWSGVRELAEFKNKLNGHLPSLIVSSSNNAASLASGLKNEAAAIVNSGSIRFTVMFRPLGELSAALKGVHRPADSAFDPQINAFCAALDDFFNSYIHYADSTNKVMSLYDVSCYANDLLNAKREIKTLSYSAGVLLNKSESEAEMFLDIYLSNVDSLKSFSEKAKTISSLYSLIAEALDISEIDNPLIIEHLEYGSFWLNIGGPTLIVSILSWALQEGGHIIHQEYMRSGKLDQLETTGKVLEQQLDLTNKLSEQGYATEGMRDRIAASTKALSRQTYKLLHDQPIIEVNDEEISIKEEYQQKLIEQSKVLQLEHYDGPNPAGG